MNELKTLKDFEGNYTLEETGAAVVKVVDLRAEAIKWIKYHDSINKELETKGLARYPNELNKWIEHFFNISNDELSK